MYYSTSWPKIVTRYQAERELKNHGLSFDEFAETYGMKDSYRSKVVLEWMGY